MRLNETGAGKAAILGIRFFRVPHNGPCISFFPKNPTRSIPSCPYKLPKALLTAMLPYCKNGHISLPTPIRGHAS